MTRAPLTRDLDPAELSRLRGDLATLAKRYPKAGDLAAALGIHQSGLSRLTSGKQGASHALASRVAELLAEQGAAVVREPVARARTTTLDDRYPTRAEAVALLRGIVPDAVLESVRLQSLEADADPGLEHWLTQIKRLARLRADIAREVEISPDETAPGKRTGR